jgi:molecular chaperone DnaJ
MSKDPYSVLGLSPDATEAEVRKAFRELARRYHPDSEFGDADKMAEVNEAYETIMNGASQVEKTTDVPASSSTSSASQAGEAEREVSEEDRSYSAMISRVFSDFGCFAENFEAINGGPPDKSEKLAKAWRQITNMDLDDAVDTLESVGESNRNGRWYYYYSMTDALLGETKESIQFATQAAKEAPNNVEIQDYYQKLTKVTKEWFALHPEDNPDVLFTRTRTIRFIIVFAIFLIVAFLIYAKTGVINIPGLS